MRILMQGIKVDQGGKGIEIDLNPKFYSREAVEVALKDFESLLSGTIAAGARISVSLKPKDRNMDSNEMHALACEFCNYVIDVMKKRGEI